MVTMPMAKLAPNNFAITKEIEMIIDNIEENKPKSEIK
jgi:hypothetical protein